MLTVLEDLCIIYDFYYWHNNIVPWVIHNPYEALRIIAIYQNYVRHFIKCTLEKMKYKIK